MIILVCGLPGSGKSFFAERLAEALSAGYISSDRLRKSMSSLPEYSEESKEKVYQEMMRITKEYAEKNKDLVIDATFHKANRRQAFFDISKDPDTTEIIEIKADESIIRERVSKKREFSDADFEIYKKIRAEWEPITQAHLVIYSNNSNIREMVETALKHIKKNDH